MSVETDVTSVRLGGSSAAASAKQAWLTVVLLFLFMLVNFADKAVIGIAAVPIMQELQLRPSEFGLIGSRFPCAAGFFAA